MDVLVTGAGGYLGKYLIQRLLGEPAVNIYALHRPGSKVDYSSDRIHVLWGDLSNPYSLVKTFEKVDNIDTIFHLAAATAGSHFEGMLNTVVGTENLLRFVLVLKPKRFVFVSSFSVYKLTALTANELLTENCPAEDNLRLRDSYTITKTRQERIVRKFCRENCLPLVVLRPGKIYGPYDYPLPPQLGLRIPGVCYLVMGGGHRIPLVHVKNCADAIWLAASCDILHEEEIVNLVDDSLPTQKQFLKLFKQHGGRIPRLVRLPDWAFRIFVKLFEKLSEFSKGNIPSVVTQYRAANLWMPLRYDNTKAKQFLGWKPGVSTVEGLVEMFQTMEIATNNKQ